MRSAIPMEIGKLTNLVRLYVSNNRLEQLPKEIALLSLLAAEQSQHQQPGCPVAARQRRRAGG